MQGQRSIFDPFPETVDLNQGGSNSNGTSMDETDDWNNMISPMERRLLNNDLSNELNFSCVNTNRHNDFQSFRTWDVGESSSRASLHDQVSNDGQQQHHESSTTHQFNMQSSASNRIPMNVNLNVGYENTNSDDDGIGPSDCGIGGSSLGSWGLSCKRKTLEGTTSTQSLMGGSSGCFPEPSRSLLNISSGQVNPVPMNHHETPSYTRVGVQESSPTPPVFGIQGSVLNLNNNDNVSSASNLGRRPNINSSHQSINRQLLLNEFLDHSRGQIGHLSNQQPPSMNVPDVPRNTHYFPWGNNVGSRSGGSTSSSMLRNNVQYHNFVPPSESRNLVQDPTHWSLATGSGGGGGGGNGAPSSSRNGGGNGGSRSINGLWTPQLNNRTTPSQQRSSEFAPWTLFPSTEVESGGQRGHISSFPAASSSSDNHFSSGVSSQRRHYRPFSRAALLMEVPGDDWRSLAADIEGRQRLVSEIRQVLNAMRRGENLRTEDYMLFDPFINGVAELHDRHRDMRLDVDNMSYEELLALEERIGDVNTGLNEEVILKSMKQRKHIAFMAISAQNLEPCCICQEEYDTGDNIGSLDCGHDFHTDCIKQWLTQKNICPICKMTGLAT